MKFTQHDKIALIRDLEFAVEVAKRMPVDKSCGDCLNFVNGICRIAGIAPPADVLPVGCEAWVFNPRDIPVPF